MPRTLGIRPWFLRDRQEFSPAVYWRGRFLENPTGLTVEGTRGFRRIFHPPSDPTPRIPIFNHACVDGDRGVCAAGCPRDSTYPRVHTATFSFLMCQAARAASFVAAP